MTETRGPRGLKPKRPGTPLHAVLGLVVATVGAWVTVTLGGVGPLLTAGVLAGGAAYGALLLAVPPRNRVLATAALLLVLVVFAFASPVQYAWMCGFIAGGIAGGHAWRRRAS